MIEVTKLDLQIRSEAGKMEAKQDSSAPFDVGFFKHQLESLMMTSQSVIRKLESYQKTYAKQITLNEVKCMRRQKKKRQKQKRQVNSDDEDQ